MGRVVVLIQIVRRNEFGDVAGGELLHQGTDGTDDLVEIGLVVLEGRDQAIEHRVIAILGLEKAHQGNSINTSAAQCGGQVAFLDGTRQFFYLCFPILHAVLIQMGLGVFNEQGFDIIDVAAHLLVVRDDGPGRPTPGR